MFLALMPEAVIEAGGGGVMAYAIETAGDRASALRAYMGFKLEPNTAD